MSSTYRDGGALFYEDVGSGKPPIVFVHGLGNHEYFRAQIDYFGQRHRVIAPDLPGFGQSDAPEREYSLTAFADDIAWLCAELELGAPIIVAHSMGGAVAIELAAAHPGLAAAIVLVDPIPIVPLPTFHPALGRLVEALRGPQYRTAICDYADQRMFSPTDDVVLRERIVSEFSRLPQHVVLPALSSVLAWNGADAARSLQIPVLLISAGDGMPSDLARLREIVPRLELGRTVGTGHFAHLIAPEQVNAMIERFLAVSGLIPTRPPEVNVA